MSKYVEIRGYVTDIQKDRLTVATCAWAYPDFENNQYVYHNCQRLNLAAHNPTILCVGNLVSCVVRHDWNMDNVLVSIRISDYSAIRKSGSIYPVPKFIFSSLTERLAAFITKDGFFDLIAMSRFETDLYEEFLNLTMSDLDDLCSYNQFSRFKYIADYHKFNHAVKAEIAHRDDPENGWGEWH